MLNKHFLCAVRSLEEAGGCSQQVLNYNSLEDPTQNIFHHFRHHPSIIAMNDTSFERLFEFKFVEIEEVTSEIKKLDPNKTTARICIAVLEENVDIFAPIFTDIFNDCVRNGTFAAELKLADILPIFKSIDSTDKKNCRPINILI